MEPALARSDSEELIALVSLSLTPRPRSRVATAIRWRLGRLGGAVTYSKNQQSQSYLQSTVDLHVEETVTSTP
jgi:hypothetical protein